MNKVLIKEAEKRIDTLPSEVLAFMDSSRLLTEENILTTHPSEIDFLKKFRLIDEEFKLTHDGHLFGTELCLAFYPKT